MFVNFKFLLDVFSLLEIDFEVLDRFGNIYILMCVVLVLVNENGENWIVLLIGEFGIVVINLFVEVRVVDDLFIIVIIFGEFVCLEIINLNGIIIINVILFVDGLSLFFV